jgi:hypothetical protein
MTTVFFHVILWKKQAPNACFNLFLVLLLSPESVAAYVYNSCFKKLPPFYLSRCTIRIVLSKFFMSSYSK